MATNKQTTFSTMLNEYVTTELLTEEFKGADNWLLKNVTYDKTWQGGKYIVPFQYSVGSSVKIGGLTGESDIAQPLFARGYLNGYVEAYGSMAFLSRDLFDHGKVSEQNFLKLLPTQLEYMIDHFKQTVSIQVLGGKHIDTCDTANTTIASDIIAVKHPERFKIGMKVNFTDGSISHTDKYVTAIDKNTGIVTLNSQRDGGGTAPDLAGMTASAIKFYIDGASSSSGFGSLKDMLLPAAQGGSDSFCNVTKSSAPFAQSVLYNATNTTTSDWGSTTAVTAATVLKMIFHASMKTRQRGGKPTVALCSYKHFYAAAASIESGASAYKNTGETVHYADYSEMSIGGVHGSIKLVAIREFDDDWIALIDPSQLKMITGRAPFELMKSPDGLSYYSVRATTGYTYICDVALRGDFLYEKPWTAGAIYNIPNYSFN